MNGTSLFLMSASDGGSTLSAINGHLAKAGISITREDALRLAESRNEYLAEIERVEFGRPAVVAIAEAVACSPHTTPGRAFDTLLQLQSVFYAVRDELSVDVPDDEIVEAIANCLDELGDAFAVATMPHDELMSFSKAYVQALEAEEATAYRIVDDEGHAYAFDPAGWDYDETAPGWDGERWSDDWDD